MALLKFKLAVIGICFALMPLLEASLMKESEKNHHIEEKNDLKNLLLNHGYDGSGEPSEANFEINNNNNNEDDEDFLYKRYRLMGKRSKYDDLVDDDLDLDKRYRLMGKRYRLMGKRYRLMGKRGSSYLNEDGGDSLENDDNEETDEGENLEKRYRLMGKRYRLMGKRGYLNEDLTEENPIKRYRLYG